METIDYYLAESYVIVSGSIKHERDAATNEEKTEADATVAVGMRGDETDKRPILFGKDGADDDFTVVLTSDQRLSSVQYKSVGIGGRLIGTTATIVGFVGGLARSVVRMGTAPEKRKTPEEAARAKWDGDHPREAGLLGKYKAIAERAADGIVAAHEDSVTATTPAVQATALARVRRLEQSLIDSRREIERIEALYRAWRAQQVTTRSELFTYNLSIAELARDPNNQPGNPTTPNISELGEKARKIWTDLGVIVQVGAPDGRMQPPRRDTPEYKESEEHRRIRWRIPRPVRMSIWRLGEENECVLERTFPSLIVDEQCDTAAMTLESNVFGEQSAEIEFSESGIPTKFVHGEKGPLGSFADALKDVPSTLVAGLQAAKDTTSSLTTLADANEERELAGLKRRVERAQQELERKGLDATAEQFAELKRLEQQVAIGDAQGKLAPPSELDALKSQLELVQTRSSLHAAERTEALDSELADIRAEVARLEERVRKSEAKQKL